MRKPNCSTPVSIVSPAGSLAGGCDRCRCAWHMYPGSGSDWAKENSKPVFERYVQCSEASPRTESGTGPISRPSCFTSPLRGCQFLTKKKRRAPSLEPVMANQTGGKSGPVQFRSSWTGALSQHLLLARIMHLRALFDREGMPHLFFWGGGALTRWRAHFQGWDDRKPYEKRKTGS